MDFDWTQEQRELLDAVQHFASEQLVADFIDNARHERWKKCAEFGI